MCPKWPFSPLGNLRASGITAPKKNDAEDGVSPLPFSKDIQGKWDENGKKGKTEHLEKTKQRNRGRKADKRRDLSFTGIAPSWTCRAMALNNFGRSFLIIWQEATEQGRSRRLLLKYTPVVSETLQRLVSSWYSKMLVPHGCDRYRTSF